MSQTFHATDQDAEASHIFVRAVPGAIFIRLHRESGGKVKRRMFVELNLKEAMQLERDLKDMVLAAMTPA